MSSFSDYIVYADESGSPNLDAIDPDFPVFVLAMLLVRKDSYANQVVPAVEALKFDFVGHDQIILHERDIRRQTNAFAFLQVNKATRNAFLGRIDKIVRDAPVEVFAGVIHKEKLKQQYAHPFSPYHIGLMFLMERILRILVGRGEAGKMIHVVFECRGKKEDAELELEFRRIADNKANWGYKNPDFKQLSWEPLFVDKKANSSGLQMADLMARPIGIKRIRPLQPNHAYDIIASKVPPDGLKWFP